jgi:hypothetical protein
MDPISLVMRSTRNRSSNPEAGRVVPATIELPGEQFCLFPPVSGNGLGLPTCRVSGMSAGPNPPRCVRYRVPAAAPRHAARAGTLLLSEVRLTVESAGARSPFQPATLPASTPPSHAPFLATI